MENVRYICAAVGAALAWLIGGFDELFKILVVFAIIDYASGITAAWMAKEVSSSRGLRGIAKKVFLLTLVVVADKIDYVLGGNGFLRNSIIYGLMANETISILENCGRMGIPIPKQFFSALEKLQSKTVEKE
jgi:toxin secretion/phage lysis holin